MTQNCDIIIIGGGMAGTSVAACLADKGDVVVLEAEEQQGYHATGRSAAIYIPNYGNGPVRSLTLASRQLLESPPADMGGTSFLSARGRLVIASRDQESDFKKEMQVGADLQQISTRQALEIVPILKPEAAAMAAYEESARDIDVDRLLQSYAKKLRHNGGKIVTGARVSAISRGQSGAHAWQVDTTKGQFSAPLIINAAGAWADDVANMAGVKPAGLSPRRRSAALLPNTEHLDWDAWPLFGPAIEEWYAKPEAGLLMVSPADEDPVDPHDAFADDMVLAEGLYRFELCVNLPISRIDHNWAGLRTFAPDRTPVVGFAPDTTGFFWLAGQGGYGIQIAPALAELSASLIQGEMQPDTPEANLIKSLSPKRFS